MKFRFDFQPKDHNENIKIINRLIKIIILKKQNKQMLNCY